MAETPGRAPRGGRRIGSRALKRLVVTADDVGLHPAMTAGALRAHDEGIVTAVSVAAVGSDLAGAAAALKARPGLACGIHLVLVGERPLSPPREVASLLARGGGFHAGFRAFAARYARGAIVLAEVEREWRRQIEAILELGLQPLHLNTHQHLHALPRLYELAARLARDYSVPWLRLPIDPAVRGFGRRALEIRVLNRLARLARAAHRRSTSGARPVPSTLTRTAGIQHAGHLTVERLLAIIRNIDSPTELVCHPGGDDGALRRAYDWGYDWEAETIALCDPRVRDAIVERGIAPSGFSELD